MKLLNIDANAKTVKGQKIGFMTAVLYLAPFKMSGFNVCPMAEVAGCWKGCLNTAGRGGISKGSKRFRTPVGLVPDNTIQRCRIKRTKMWAEDRDTFWIQLRKEITAFIKRAERKGLTPVVRLNGTSDIQWERFSPYYPGGIAHTIFEMFPDVQFYDYTKIYKRCTSELPDNYHLSLSYSEANEKYAAICRDMHRDHGVNLIKVYRDKLAVQNARTFYEEARANVIDGDANDLRFLDKPNSIVILKAKGSARKDQSGFVLD